VNEAKKNLREAVEGYVEAVVRAMSSRILMFEKEDAEPTGRGFVTF